MIRLTAFALTVIAMLQNSWVAAVAADTYVYVSAPRENSLVVLRMNEADGQLTPVETTRSGPGTGSLATDPERKYLFASVRGAASLASFQIDRSTGKVTLLNTVKLDEGANAAYVATDRQGKYLFGASYSGGLVTVHAIGSDGRLGNEPVQVVQAEKTAHSAVVDSANRLLFVPHVAPNAVFQFRLDANTGKLTALPRAPGGAPQAGPRHLALHPSGRFACTSDESGSSVTLYALDAEKGLSPLQTLSTLPADFRDKNSTADVKFHPSGKFVWVSNRGHDSLAGFRFDVASARLTALPQTPTEKTPRSFDLEPGGRYLYSAGEGSGKLAAYRIDAETGALTRFATYELGQSLSWVSVVRP